MNVFAKLIAVTQPVAGMPFTTPLELIAYCARVSSTNQENPDYMGLLNYCMKHQHWSVFTMANAVIEIRGPRDITRQFTRHESLAVIEVEPGDYQAQPDGMDKHAGGLQEFSQRYAEAPPLISRQMRLQDHANRQNSIEAEDDFNIFDAESKLEVFKDMTQRAYSGMLKQGIAKECARVILPEGLSMSKLYVNATLRSWMHYLDVREGGGTQLEHKQLAALIRGQVALAFPEIVRA